MVQAGKAKGALTSGWGYHMFVIVSVSTHLKVLLIVYVMLMLVMVSKDLMEVTGPGPGQPKRPRLFDKRNMGYSRVTRLM